MAVQSAWRLFNSHFDSTKTAGVVYQQFPFWLSSLCLPNLVVYFPPSPLLHCSTHGSPTTRPTLLLAESPLATKRSHAPFRVSPHSIAPLAGDERSLRVQIHRDQHCWIEIGSGTRCEMTPYLLATGAPVHAIEIDPAFPGPASAHHSKQFPNLNVVIPGDILEADIVAISRPGVAFASTAIFPTTSPSPILHHLFTFADFIDESTSSSRPKSRSASPRNPARADYGYLSVVTPSSNTRPEFVFANSSRCLQSAA